MKRKKLRLKIQFNYMLIVLLLILLFILLNNINGVNGAFILSYIDITFIVINYYEILRKEE